MNINIWRSFRKHFWHFFTSLCMCLPLPSFALSIEAATYPLGTKLALLSPDGKHIAKIGYNGTNHGLILFDIDSNTSKFIVTGKVVVDGYYKFRKAPLNAIWVTNDLLAVDFGNFVETVDLDGKLVASLDSGLDSLRIFGKIDGDTAEAPLIAVQTQNDGRISLINSRTASKVRMKYPESGSVVRHAFDKAGKLRFVSILNSSFWSNSSKITHWYRTRAGKDWQKIAEFKVTDDFWEVLYVPEEDDSLVILSNAGRDTKAVFRYNVAKREISEMMAGHPTQDIVDVEGLGQAEFKSVSTSGLRKETFWFDAQWKAMQTSVDAALPDRINIMTGDPKKRVLVFSYADVDPGRWYLFDIPEGKMSEVANLTPSIDPTQMRKSTSVHYPARDGLSIPAFITRPEKTHAPQPTVVMVHGGPVARDYWQWNADVQLLAANGYVVFQPQFRGSSGFGKKFKEAGVGQWGLSMQDDISDGVAYLIKQGIADPKRICIYGASYGGYAALWGAISTPQLYRCAISFAGVVDVNYMLDDNSDVNSEKVGREYRNFYVGEKSPKNNAVSPLLNADKLNIPLLLMHGSKDKRVPIKHSEKLKSALDKHNKIYQWVEFPREGHSISYVASMNKYYQEILNFLSKHLLADVQKTSHEESKLGANADANHKTNNKHRASEEVQTKHDEKPLPKN